jgi:hypothetical protein
MIVAKVMTKAIYKLAQAMIFLECVYRLVRFDVVKTKLGHPFYTFTSYLPDFIKRRNIPLSVRHSQLVHAPLVDLSINF